MAYFDKAIPPGGEGKINLKINTKEYQGSIIKGARVYSNDPNKKFVSLTIKAFIKVPIYISPRLLHMYTKEGEKTSRVISVNAELDKPLKLTPVDFNLAEKLTYTIEEVEKDRKFYIRFTSIPGPPGPYHGFLKLKTNYPEKPEIMIQIRGMVKKKQQAKVSKH